MDNAAQPAGRVPERVTVTRQSPIRLCDFIPEYAAAARITPNTAASELVQNFRRIHDRFYQEYEARRSAAVANDHARLMAGLPVGASFCERLETLPSPVCWVVRVDGPNPVEGCRIYAFDVADYFAERVGSKRNASENIRCESGGLSGQKHVPEELVLFAPEPLARLLEDAGEPVPKFLQNEPPAAASQPAPPASKPAKPVTTRKTKAAPTPKEKPMDARELTSTRRLMRAFVQIIAAAAQDERPEVRQLAATLSLDASPYTTAGQVMRLADLIGAPLPANQKTIEKFLADPDDL